MAGCLAQLTGCTSPFLIAVLLHYAARRHQAVGRTMAYSTGLWHFPFEADGPLLRLPKRIVDGMIRGEDRMLQSASQRLRAASA